MAPSRNKIRKASQALKIVKYTLGAGPHTARRFNYPDGSVKIRLSHTFDGHGATAREASNHLAGQLRELARLIEAHEGILHTSQEGL